MVPKVLEVLGVQENDEERDAKFAGNGIIGF
jgi:hypothetical protein